jgi:EpsI family protein
MQGKRRLLTMLGAMCGASVLAWKVSPPEKQVRTTPQIDLDTLIPSSFGEWNVAPKRTQTVNPQTQALLDKLYSQILERTYQNAKGDTIMLAIAYGDDQRGSMEAHKPEVCYPAQGFAVLRNEQHSFQTPFGAITARRLQTRSSYRDEPLIYWFTVANNTVQTKLDKRLIELKLALTGTIPDGMLFRVSSIEANTEQGWAQQESFVRALLASMKPEDRARVAGLQG